MWLLVTGLFLSVYVNTFRLIEILLTVICWKSGGKTLLWKSGLILVTWCPNIPEKNIFVMPLILEKSYFRKWIFSWFHTKTNFRKWARANKILKSRKQIILLFIFTNFAIRGTFRNLFSQMFSTDIIRRFFFFVVAKMANN